jgi:glycosyltransferase involved in cell wall biosynthesis
LLYKATGRRFVYDQHDLNPEVYVARFGRTGLLYRGLLLLERATYAVADHVISTIESYQETARVRGKVPAERNSIVRSAPDPDRLRRGAPDPTCRNGREYLVCYLGIIDAVAHLVHERGREDIQVGLLGFGDCLEELRERATRLGGVPYVTFTGKVGPDEIGRWLSTADLGATPDPKNPFNDKSTMNKTLEYMAYELPVVGYDLVENRRSAGDAAVYVREDSGAALGDAIAEMLDDPERRARLGAIGRARIVDGLRWSNQAPVYVRVFEDLLGQRTGPDKGSADTCASV